MTGWCQTYDFLPLTHNDFIISNMVRHISFEQCNYQLTTINPFTSFEYNILSCMLAVNCI